MSARSSLPQQAGASPGWNPLTLAVLAALWIAGLPNWPLWRALLALPETLSGRGLVFVAGFGMMVAALTVALLVPLAWRWSIKPAITVVLVIAAFGAHFMGSYGVVIDTPMMVNVLQTNPSEVRDLLNLRLLATMALLAGLPLWLLWRAPVGRTGAWRQLGRNLAALCAAVAVLAGLVFALFADLSATMRNHRSMRYLINPVNSLYALVDLAAQSQSRPAGPPQPIGIDARSTLPAPEARPPLVALVIGETARADHFGLNGYQRPTDAALAGLDVLSFHDVQSCGTSTAQSLPCMFSALDKKAFESRRGEQENLLDLARRAGLAVLWVDNQAGCKGLCDRVAHADAHDPIPGVSPLPADLCDGDECLDAALLHGLDERLAALPAASRERGVLLVLHQMGSHGPSYYKRSPPAGKPFQPECTTNVLQQCDRAALINAYDNSITYTAHVLAQTIAWLQHQAPHYDATLLYVSDHGESLGENNLYLHGLPYALAPREQTHVPMLLWMAPQTKADDHLSAQCLRGLLDVPLTHDNLFHTVVGLLGITAREYNKKLDALASCRREP
jgi:lipid A ethanolaminephosphotransferase